MCVRVKHRKPGVGAVELVAGVGNPGQLAKDLRIGPVNGACGYYRLKEICIQEYITKRPRQSMMVETSSKPVASRFM
jgi:hypothetical protein